MAFNGSGTFSIINAFVPGTTILSSSVNQNFNDIASGLSNTMCKDGQQIAAANQNMGNFRLTSLHTGSARSDSSNLGQVQDATVNWIAAGGAADAITATYAPPLTGLIDGQFCFFRATAANATTTPTFNPNGLGANTITKKGGAAVLAGDIPGNLAEVVLRYNLANTRWELINPAAFSASAGSLTPIMFANETVPFATAMINGTIVQSQAGNAQTFAVKTLAGADPSAADPVIFIFRDNITATGDYAVLQATAALNITIPSGGTIDTQNAQANRIWIGAFNKGGTVVLGVYNALFASVATSPQILCWDESTPTSGTAISSTSSNAGVWYTNGAVSAGSALRVIGYAESNQATAGTWTSTPTKLKLFSAGDKKPGDTVQKLPSTTSVENTAASTTFVPITGQSASITPQSAANLIAARVSGMMTVTGGSFGELQLSRGTVAATNMIGSIAGLQTNAPWCSAAVLEAFDLPNTTSPTIYAVQGRNTNAPGTTTNFSGNATPSARQAQYVLEEIQA